MLEAALNAFPTRQLEKCIFFTGFSESIDNGFTVGFKADGGRVRAAQLLVPFFGVLCRAGPFLFLEADAAAECPRIQVVELLHSGVLPKDLA